MSKNSKLEKELLAIAGDNETAQLFARMLAHVHKAPTRSKKSTPQETGGSVKHLHTELQEQCGIEIPYSSGNQFGYLGKQFSTAKVQPEEVAPLAAYIAEHQYPWYESNGIPFTITTVVKNLSRWVEYFRQSGQQKPKSNQGALKIR